MTSRRTRPILIKSSSHQLSRPGSSIVFSVGAPDLVSGLPAVPKDKDKMVKALVMTKILPLFNLKDNLVEIELESDTTDKLTG